MKKNRFTGWQKVFSFTLIQTIKTPAMIFTTIFLFAIALLALPAMSLLSGLDGEKVKDSTTIDRLVIVDETPLELKNWLDVYAMGYEGALPEKIEFSSESYDTLVEALTEETEEAWALVRISFNEEEGSFPVMGAYGAKTSVSEDDLAVVTDLIAQNMQTQMVDQLGITQEQMAYLNHSVEQKVSFYRLGTDGEAVEIEDQQEEEQQGLLSSIEYSVLTMSMVLVIIIVSMSGEQVAAAVVQEKSSKVVEYLLINVRPLALMIGKILAVFVITLGQLLLMLLGFVASAGIYVVMNPGTALSVMDILTQMAGDAGASAGMASSITVNFAALPIAVLLILGGALFYSTVAALAGASVSRMEEMTESMKLFSVLLVIGAYAGLMVVMMDMMGEAPAALRYTMELLPVTSPFITPGYLLLDRAPLWVGLASLLLMVVMQLLLFMFSANVYETLIYHKGNPLKLKDLLRINKDARGAKH